MEIEKQRDMNHTTFQTICDNFCRIRYNNLSLVSSTVRKFFVYNSSAIANTQFDIQGISQKLSSSSLTACYDDFRQELHLPNCTTGQIYQIKRPQNHGKTVPDEVSTITIQTRWHSDELPIPVIELNDEKSPCKSADMIDEQLSNEIFSYSLQLLDYIALNRSETDCQMIRKVIAALTSVDPLVVNESTKQIDEYIQRNEIT